MTQFIALCGRGTIDNEFVSTARVGKDEVARILREEQSFRSHSFALPLKQASQLLFGLTDDQVWNDKYKEQVIPMWDLTPRQIFQRLGTEGGRLVFREDMWGALAIQIKTDIENGVSKVPVCISENTIQLKPNATLSDMDLIFENVVKLIFQLDDAAVSFSKTHDACLEGWHFTFDDAVQKLKFETIPAVLEMPAKEALDFFVSTRLNFPVLTSVSNGPYGMPPLSPSGLVIPDCRFDNEAEIVRSNGGFVTHVCRELPPSMNIVAGHASEKGVTPANGDLFIYNNGSIIELKTKVETLLSEAFSHTPRPSA